MVSFHVFCNILVFFFSNFALNLKQLYDSFTEYFWEKIQFAGEISLLSFIYLHPLLQCSVEFWLERAAILVLSLDSWNFYLYVKSESEQEGPMFSHSCVSFVFLKTFRCSYRSSLIR